MSSTDIQQKWGELIPKGGLVQETFVLNQKEHILGRRGDLKVDNPKVSGQHCVLKYDYAQKKAYIIDVSSNGTSLFNKKLEKNKEVELENGDLVNLLQDKSQWIGYIFKLVDNVDSFNKDQQDTATKNNTDQKQLEQSLEQYKQNEKEQQEQNEQIKKMQNELEERLKKVKEDDEHFEKDQTCVVCIDLLYNPYLMTPCLHNYCCDCMCELLKNKDIACPQCREKPISVQKNYQLNNLIEAFIKRNPDKKWQEDVIKKKNESNLLNKDFLDQINEKLSNKTKKVGIYKRQRSYSDSESSDRNNNRNYSEEDEEEFDEDEEEEEYQYNNNQPFQQFGYNYNFIMPAHLNRCVECQNARQDDNFKCSPYQQHIKCINCDKMMPQRNDNNLYPQNCTICERSFCNLYFKQDCSSKYNSSISHHLRLFQDIPIPQVLNNNVLSGREEEIQVLKDFIEDDEMRTLMIYDYVNENFVKQGKFKYEICQKYMKTTENKSFDINSDTPLCTNCWPNIWNQMVLKYRIAIKDQLPKNVKDKPDCWYGVNCYTRNPQHNKIYNHACPQIQKN
ncbi:FHA domain protein (macronuclear) [Tetrahymena thermophila SB210]|uniref:E3 ubiquitin-protein ligase CHFR n=1 Tax=Tetrahymena thermophila (strain SB210) TaxID=312017 RepID=Q22W29_TETTS|nr:FHA domain protein [Tetrahymena thermophila SB210]EAR89588.2 FHA domain protein [Tetrahymena thermophila SB210]|eukprot:XP_001009833.2 FHA domain protein [Tetrahymena thermophila SB210]